LTEEAETMPWRTIDVKEQRMQFVIRATKWNGAALGIMPGVWNLATDRLSVATTV